MGTTIRRSDGTLVAATGFAEVFPTAIPNPNQPQLWRPDNAPGPASTRGDAKGKRTSANSLANTQGYGRAWENLERDIPNEPSAGRSMVLRTDRDLQLGPVPGHIARINTSKNAGLVGPNSVNSFPPDANMGYMQHQQIGKLVQGAVPALKTIADDAWLPGVFAGNPV